MEDHSIGSDDWRAQDKGPSIVAICWSVTALSTVFVTARLYVRGVMLKKLHSDDYFSLVALVRGRSCFVGGSPQFRSNFAFRSAATS